MAHFAIAYLFSFRLFFDIRLGKCAGLAPLRNGKVWVVNKTGVSLAYRAPDPKKEQDQSDAVAIRRPTNACYRTDGDAVLFAK